MSLSSSWPSSPQPSPIQRRRRRHQRRLHHQGRARTGRVDAMPTSTGVGFYEEDASQSSTNPATAGTGRVVISTVASKDGNKCLQSEQPGNHRPDETKSGYQAHEDRRDSARSAHHHGTNFSSRPPALYDTARIGDTTPPNPSLTPIPISDSETLHPTRGHFPQSCPKKFSPRGEARIDNSTNTVKTVCEIGILLTHGMVVDVNSANVVAIQFRGFGGNFQIYRP